MLSKEERDLIKADIEQLEIDVKDCQNEEWRKRKHIVELKKVLANDKIEYWGTFVGKCFKTYCKFPDEYRECYVKVTGSSQSDYMGVGIMIKFCSLKGKDYFTINTLESIVIQDLATQDYEEISNEEWNKVIERAQNELRRI